MSIKNFRKTKPIQGSRFGILTNYGNENENEEQNLGNENENLNENVNVNENLNENINLDKYYIDNYIITQKEWFNILIDKDIQIAIDIYNNIQMLRLYKKILEIQNKIIFLNENPDNENKIKKLKYQEYYHILNQKKLDIYILVYGDKLSNFNKVFRTKRFLNGNIDIKIEDIDKLIKWNLKEYYRFKQFFEHQKKILDLRRLGLLEWIYNTERSLLELIVHKQMLFEQNKNIKNRNYNKTLENYANNKGKTKNEYMRNRNSIEQIKFNNFNLFTEVKKKHLKSEECAYQFERRGENNTFHLSSDFNNITFDEFFDSLELKKLSFFKRIKYNYENIISVDIIYNCLKNLTNLYLVPVYEDDSKILRVSRDIVLMAIAFILYLDNYNININNSNKLGEGAFAIVKKKNKKAIKYENIRIIAKDNEERLRFGKRINKPIYTKQNYISAMHFITFIIHKYLYNLQQRNINNEIIKSYVPNIYDFKFDYKKGITEIIMNTSLENSDLKYSYSLKQILNNIKLKNNIETKNIKNLHIFILKILLKVCEILIFYQDKCYFVHRDFNAGNIMVNFDININNEFNLYNFEVKIIDFMSSSIVINNIDNKKTILKLFNYRPGRNFNISNPYVNKELKYDDLKWLFILIFSWYPQNKSISYLKKIFKVNEKEIIEQIKKNTNLINELCFGDIEVNSKYSKIIFKKVFGNNFDTFLFDPNNLKIALEKLN